MILISGATGTVGRAVLEQLAAQGVPARAMVRDRRRAEALRAPLVELVEADFDRPDTLLAALAGVERAFLLTNSTERAEAQQLAFVDAARRCGVRRIVKLSQLHASHDSPVRFLRYHAAVEAAIQAAGVEYTFLRPNLFMQGLLQFRPMIVAESAFYAPAGDARVSVVDVRDIAAAAVAALTDPHHTNTIYDLTGPEALSHAAMADMLSSALGRTITFVDTPPDAMRGFLMAAQMPEWQIEGLLEDYAHYRRDEASAVTTGVQTATGAAPHSFASFVQDHRALFV